MSASYDHRRDPDALLAQIVANETRVTRARLKIFLGAAPGVGKTYAMLEAARHAHADGTTVLVGAVDTHGRVDTSALLEGLNILPPRRLDYRGIVLEELDLDGALASAPDVLLVDELAHTNAHGSRHAKRWQDVLELLAAGIEVWTTVNVQHVESLGDVIQQITGVRVRETVPDAVLERADELELVDLSPDELIQRLAEGKVYAPEQATRAARQFFVRGNLLALRELAMRCAAAHVDAEVVQYRREHGIAVPWPTREHIMVCVGASPGSEPLIRATKRMADGLHVEWSAATVEVIGAPPLSRRDHELLEAHLRLVDTLDGSVVRLRHHKVADALLAHAREHNITRIVAGKPTHPRWRDRLRGSMLDELIRGSGAIDVHVIAPVERAALSAPAHRHSPERPTGWQYLWATAIIAFVTALGLALYGYVTIVEITMAYLLAIMLASLHGHRPSLLAASLSVLAFDVCFVPPRFQLAVSDPRYLITFAVMFAAGLTISTLVVRLRRQQHDAITRERRTALLQAFTRDVAAALDIVDVAVLLARHVEASLDVAAAVLVPDANGELSAAAGLTPLAVQEQAVARWAFEHRQSAGHGTDTLSQAKALCVPLVAADQAVGVVALQLRPGAQRLGHDHRQLLDVFARQAALAIARVQLADQAKESAVRARTEELRSALLSTVSHDLRTPLAVIIGAATSLVQDGEQLTPAARTELLQTIVEDARRLERVLTNLLQLTRAESGLEPLRECILAEEAIGSALTRTEDVRGGRRVETDVPPDLHLDVAPVLFEQVLINLIENAVKHGAPPITIRARRIGDDVEITIADRGPGLPPGDTMRLFDKFVRASATPGAGLGLAVVRAIVVAHGGSVHSENQADGGAIFRVRLPTRVGS